MKWKTLLNGAASIGEAFGSLLDFSPGECKPLTFPKRMTVEEAWEADRKAIEGDWKKVIGDFNDQQTTRSQDQTSQGKKQEEG